MKLLFALLLLSPCIVQAKIISNDVEYKDKAGNTFQGYLAFDDSVKGPRPGVLVVHEWKGLDAYAKMRTDQLAKLGYVAFAADIYGKGVRPIDASDAGRTAGIYKQNRPLLRERVLMALEKFKQESLVDKKRIAAIGYCFGGTTALELGRAGADVKGIVSFHGGLDNPTPDDAKNIKAKVLVLHGADDPNVPDEQVAAFEKEMRAAKVDWQLVKYSGAVHGFTNSANGNDNSKGVAYNAEADKRSWTAMRDFFQEIFGR
ncbi:MAG: dienelactone hydrolase family protein [Bdellovibrionota bacterium]